MTVLSQLPLQNTTVALRRATALDVPEIVDLLAGDQLGATRDGAATDEELQPYLHAFKAIDADPAQLLLVATDDTQVLATMQLTFLPGLSRRGALRAQIEAVRVRDDYRSRGLGAPCSTGRSKRRAVGTALWSSSPRTSLDPTRTASTSAWASSPRTKDSS